MENYKYYHLKERIISKTSEQGHVLKKTLGEVQLLKHKYSLLEL